MTRLERELDDRVEKRLGDRGIGGIVVFMLCETMSEKKLGQGCRIVCSMLWAVDRFI
jgi:hypothetical protein